MEAISVAPRSLQIILPKFDLSYVIDQMSSNQKYINWSVERMQSAIKEYEFFLALCLTYSDESLGISPDADCVWHHHILNTRRYTEDCLGYFGHYFHHTPVCTKEENLTAQKRTNELLLKHFGMARLAENQLTCVGNGCMNNG